MPCTYDETPEEIEARRKKENEALIAPYKAETDRVTAMLCGLMTALEPITTFVPPVTKRGHKSPVRKRLRIRGVNGDGGTTIDLDPELSAWWIKHQQADKRRKRDELRTAALAKLTPEEIEALGLDDDTDD